MFFKMIQLFDAFLLDVLRNEFSHRLVYALSNMGPKLDPKAAHWNRFRIKCNFIDLEVSLQDVWSHPTVIRRLFLLAIIQMINPIRQNSMR